MKKYDKVSYRNSIIKEAILIYYYIYRDDLRGYYIYRRIGAFNYINY